MNFSPEETYPAIVILDSSVCSANFSNEREYHSIHQFLYEGLKGLRKLTAEDIHFLNNGLSMTNTLLHVQDPIVPYRVVQELQTGLRILNGQIRHIDHSLQPSGRKFNGGRIHRRKLQTGLIEEDEREVLELLRDYTRSLDAAINRCKNRDPLPIYNSFERRFYELIEKAAYRNSGDFHGEKIATKSKRRSAGYDPDAKEADEDVIATAFTVALSKPTLILTRDKRLARLVDRVKEKFEDTESRIAYRLPSVHLCSIQCHNPYPGENLEIGPLEETLIRLEAQLA